MRCFGAVRVDLAFIGFGHVGRRFARLLDERRQRLHDECGAGVLVTAIVTRHHGSVASLVPIDAVAAAERLERTGTLDAPHGHGEPLAPLDAIAHLSRSDAALRVVIETTTLDVRSGQPATEHVEAALDAGCHVVTANKGPVAFAYERLAACARRTGRLFRFEGAVMDGVPVFNLVREALPLAEVLAVRGVLNSTTTHVLSAMERGEAFAAALARMQAQGIAEADPSLDVDGWDAAAKVAALANVLMDARITPHDVRRTGISERDGPWAREAVERGGRVRLVARAVRGQPPVVQPLELPPGDILASLEGTGNALVLTTDVLGEVVIAQPAGDLTATAYALLADLVSVIRTSGPA